MTQDVEIRCLPFLGLGILGSGWQRQMSTDGFPEFSDFPKSSDPSGECFEELFLSSSLSCERAKVAVRFRDVIRARDVHVVI